MLQKLIDRNFRNTCRAFNLTTYFTNRNIYLNVPHNKLMRLEKSNFQPRILKYFINDIDVLKHNGITKYAPENYKPDNLRKVKYKELNNLIRFLLAGNFSNEFKYYLLYLDKECCLRLPQLTFSQTFEILNLFFYYLPNQITSLEFYNKSLYMISFSVELCSKLELIQLCFYVALQKKSKQSQNILTKCLGLINRNYLNVLNTNDMAILCNSCFKTSTRIKFKPVLNKFVEMLNNNLTIINDPPIFIELVKSLRHNEHQNEEILTTISHAISFNKTINYYNFTGCAHILALYSGISFYEEPLIKLLSDKCVEYLQTAKLPESKIAHFSTQIRIKDLANFLWALGLLSYEGLHKDVIRDNIEPYLKKYITLRNLEKDVEYVIDILLSLYMLGYKPEEQLLVSVVTNKTASSIYAKRKQMYSTRFNLLLTCIKLEQEEVFDKLSVRSISPPELNIDSQLKNRQLLKSLYESLNAIASNFDIKKLEYTMAIPHLHIMGITGYNKQNQVNLHVELVDETLLVQNISDKANGFINLKIRLLRKTAKNILVVFQSEIADKDKTELDKYLEKKLKRIYIP